MFKCRPIMCVKYYELRYVYMYMSFLNAHDHIVKFGAFVLDTASKFALF